ncbi:hypothetical protein M422DRAFT_269467 [Sphaerobolus stellatus SS14]|uniref:ORC1/DEAH AAA+ ATPase domain-containing protein n=1 Tax=Sphaerobolus stellatus (strain SS14) TaxID=990650 RepID=A0A0C9U4K1_SPHS4|nr:hypothetical protein M422DRAFT_269467 [Sphaerobolus stellatus SS14]
MPMKTARPGIARTISTSNDVGIAATLHTMQIQQPPLHQLASKSTNLPFLSTVDTLSGVLQDVGKLIEHFPYIEGIAGILRGIIKIRQEMKDAEEYCKEVIDHVLDLSNEIILKLQKISESIQKDRLEHVQNDLKEYHGFLKEVLHDVEKYLQGYQDRNLFVKWIYRNTDIIKKLEKRTIRFKEKYESRVIFNIAIMITAPQNSTSTNPPPLWTPIPNPAPMFGRGSEMEDMLSHMRANKPLRIAILGPGGMGKTTLALHFLHTQAVMEEYPSRLFISCEGRNSLDELLLDLAEQIRIPSEQRKEYLQDQILVALRDLPTVICIDNLETLWESAKLRPVTEDFLNRLSSIQSLGLIITIRGNQRPNRVTWPRPLLKPLPSLSIESSLQTFEEIVGLQPDNKVEMLLQEVEGIPLAITLISYLIRDNVESPDALWRRWQQEKNRVLETGPDKNSSLTISISLSFNSSRMTDDSRELLWLLSFLPDGLSNVNEMLEDITGYIPHFCQALSVLKSVSLVQINRQLSVERIHILSPIKYFTLGSMSSFKLQESMLEFFVNLLSKYNNKSDPQAHQIIPGEFYNISHLLTACYDKGQPELNIIQATIKWTNWALYLGRPLDNLIIRAIENAYVTDLKADCHSALGQVCLYKDKLHDAQSAFQEALGLHKQAQSILGQATDLRWLGDLYLLTGHLEEAEKSFLDAVEYHKQAQDILGQADDLWHLGNLYLRRGQLEEAETSLLDALELYKQAQDILGQANDLRCLGDLYLRRGQLEEAEKSILDALELHKQAQSIFGQAYDLQSLGDLYLCRGQLEEAEKSLLDALELHKQAQDSLGKANDLQSLGDLYLRRGQLEEAEQSFLDALELHKQAQDILGQANDLWRLGNLYLRRGQLEEAEKSFLDALELHKQVQDILGQANDLWRLGSLYLQRGQLEEAEKSLLDALELHKQAQDILGQANDFRCLGDLYLRRGQLEEAEKSLLDALELHKQAQSIFQQAYDLQSLGDLYLRRGQLEEAEKSLLDALELHKQAQSIYGQAYDLQSLGDLYLCRGQLVEAKRCLNTALQLFRDIKLPEWETHALQLLSKLSS